MDTLGYDPYGIAYSNVRYKNPNVKPVALGAEGGPLYQPARKMCFAETIP